MSISCYLNGPSQIKDTLCMLLSLLDLCILRLHFAEEYDQFGARTALWSSPASTPLLSFCHFTDCRPTAGSSVDAEGQVNKSTASYAKLIIQRSNCAALAHPHMDRYRQEFAHIHVHTCNTNTYMHLYTPVIKLMVTLETHRFVTNVCVFIYVYQALT